VVVSEFVGERGEAILAPRDEDQLHVGLAGEATRNRLADALDAPVISAT